MPKDWTTDGFDGLSDDKLHRLYENPLSVSQRPKNKLTEPATKLLPLIEEELKRRNAAQPMALTAPKRTPRSDKGRIERQYAEAIVELVAKLNSAYDISSATAAHLSRGIPKFKAREPLAKTGEAFVGGARRAGKVAIDRYTPYRIQKYTVILSVVLEKEQPVETLKFIIRAPSHLLKNPKPLTEIRTTANDQASLRNEEFAEVFDNFSDAAKLYESLIAKLAPARSLAI